jgi:SNF2 family DNA or RNA helicase
MFAEISETQIISVQFAMSLLLRLQQVVCGYVPAEHIETGEKELVEIDPGKPNPRLKLLYEITEDVPHQAIIWARFTRDIENIQKMLGDRCCLYYGKMGDTEREASLKQFREGTRQLLVANPACAGEGLTLTNAKTVIYYSSDYRFSVRRQSEDRAHRIGQADSVLYVDIVCSGTVDERIIKNLTAKNATACEITGDQLREWLTLPTLGA